MHPRSNLSLGTLLMVISLLAIAGGLVTVVVTSPQSFDLARQSLLQAIIAPEATPTVTATPSLTPVPASATVRVTATATRQSIIYLSTEANTPTGPAVNTPRGTHTATPTGVILPPDVKALGIITVQVGAQLVRIHDSPNGPQIVAAVPGGTAVQVLFGSAMVDGVPWLLVRLPSGRTGWVAGYLLTITLVRADVTDIAPTAATEASSATPLPPTAPPAATSNNPPPPPGPTASPVPTNTPITLPTQPLSTHPVIRTSTPTPLPPSDTPVPPPATNTPVTPPTPTDTSPPPSDTVPPPTDTLIPPSETATP